MEQEANEHFITQASHTPSVGLSPRWVHYSGVSVEARAIAELLADTVLAVQGDNATGEIDREYLAYFAGLRRADRVKNPLNELVEVGFLTIFDGGVDPETGRRRPRRDASGTPLPARYVINLEPPAGYIGPRNASEARVQFLLDRDLAYRDVEKSGRKPRKGHVTIRRTEFGRVEAGRSTDVADVVSLPSRSPRVSQVEDSTRGRVTELVRGLPWESYANRVQRKVSVSRRDVDDLVGAIGPLLDSGRLTFEQARTIAHAAFVRATGNPVSYVVRAFTEKLDRWLGEIDTVMVVEPSKTAREGTRAAAEVGQSGMSVEEADEQIRAWYAEGGAGATAAARLLGTSWPCPDRDDYGTSPEQAMAYYADRDERAREWIKTHYDALVAALTSQRVA